MSTDYPTKSELKAIKNFVGTPREFVEYIGSIMPTYGNWKFDRLDRDGKWDGWRARFVTGGWSGCEDIISVIQKTMFSFAFHSKWERGGLWEYRINEEMIDSEGEWGTQYRRKHASANASRDRSPE